MSSVGSVTNWIEQFKLGNQDAAQRLWEEYYRRLIGLARKKLKGLPRRAADEEDVVQSAFKSFFRGLERGRFPQLRDRNSLWPLLVTITARKAYDLVNHELRPKRGGGAVGGESAFGSVQSGIGGIVGPEPSPPFVVQVAEEFERRLETLADDKLRSIALWKMEGYTNAEIAARLGLSVPTVELKLRLIRKIWEADE